jgi:GNAT superfamily N-acetyltransferase
MAGACVWSLGYAEIVGEPGPPRDEVSNMGDSLKEVRAKGFDALTLATSLLQRARLADPVAGVWEAADVQWWWRRPKRSDEVEQLFWLDDDGPVAGILLTSSADDSWQCDPVVVPVVSGLEPDVVWSRALEHAAEHASTGFAVPVSDDGVYEEVARRSGLSPDYRDSTGWMDAPDRPAVSAAADGFFLSDRTQRLDVPHHMRDRSGDSVQQRLEQCSLYDPGLDLVVETTEGRVAGYSLYWFDPTTKVGLVEPVRVEDEFQRRGLASAMLTAGIDRLVARGAERVKISYGSEAAAGTYQGVGFQPTSTTTWYRQSAG